MTGAAQKEQGSGIGVRTKVMGADFVEKAMSGDPFMAPLQEMINDHAWGSVWLRDGLDLKTKSLVTVSMLIATGKSHELKGHFIGALNNGATFDELREVALHSAVYAGYPVASEAMRVLLSVKHETEARSVA